MARPLAHLSDEELREAARAAAQPGPSSVVGMAAVMEWALEFGVFPGHTRAIEAADLYRHFRESGRRLSGHATAFWEFGSCLNRLGLQKGRRKAGGVDERPRLMAADAAHYFQAWLAAHPRPSDAEPFRGRALP